jgi:hypothetical protein
MEPQNSSTSIAQLREMARAHSSAQSTQSNPTNVINTNNNNVHNQIPQNVPTQQMPQQTQPNQVQQGSPSIAPPQVQYQQQFPSQMPQPQQAPNYTAPQPVYNPTPQSTGYVAQQPPPNYNNQVNYSTDNPLDIFGSDTQGAIGSQILIGSQPPNTGKQAPSGCIFDIKSNFRLAAIITIVVFVVGFIPIEKTIGKITPLNKIPMGSIITRSSMIGSISAILIGYFM